METEKQRIEELVKQLNAASAAYYNGQDEIMPNYEWDALFDELTTLEEKTGYIIKDSPTQNAGYEESGSGQKEPHEYPALSLAKTKQVEELQQWAGAYPIWLSWKLDGLTLVLTYDNGNLVKILTRGNGNLGTNITFLKGSIGGFPQKISYQGHLVVRGEAAISYTDFAQINDMIEDDDEKYANPRNLASGTLNLEDPAEVKARHVRFHAFTLVHLDEPMVSWGERMHFLEELGFDVVDREATTAQKLPEAIDRWTKLVESGKMDIPVDGLVICYDDTDYAASGSVTGHHATRAGFAFKWQDEIRETVLREIEWSPSRTGLINPVAIFDPVELEGTTVSRASVHNISIMEELELGIGDKIEVYKANMIIPQIAENLTRSGVKDIPERCPVCQGETKIRQVGNAKALYCMNPECQAKHVKAFALFVSRDALNIEGLSEATLEKFISRGYIHTFADIFHLDRYKDEIQGMEGFGEKSYRKLIESVKKARTTTLPRVVYSLGIAGIGLANAKVICRELKYDVEALLMVTEEELNEIQGVGEVLAKAFTGYFSDAKHVENFRKLLEELTIPEETSTKKQIFEGVNFVITGSVTHFANRGEVKELIESLGGKVTGSVTSKTNYLINNDVTSTSSKNKKANELGIPIISEETFLELVNQEES